MSEYPDLVTCKICGRQFRQIGAHVVRSYGHGMPWRDYQLKYLKLGEKTIANDLAERFREHGKVQMEAYQRSPAFSDHLAKLKSAEYQSQIAPKISESHKARMSKEQREALVSRGTRIIRSGVAHAARRQANRDSGRTVTRKCRQCGEDYESKSSSRLQFCSRKCYSQTQVFSEKAKQSGLIAAQRKHALRATRDSRVCATCGKPFVRHSGIANDGQKYCSHACANSQRQRDAEGRFA